MTEPDERFPKVMTDLPPIQISHELVFQHSANREALGYWQSKCGARPMPARSDIDPTEMRSFLSHVGLIETPDGSVARPDYRIRLAGSVIETVLGPLTGRLLHEAVPPVIAQRWRGVYEIVVTKGAPIRAVTRVSFAAQNFLMAEFLAAPLFTDMPSRVDTLFVSLAFSSQHGDEAP